jgi:leucyl-tRNA synthetase
MGVYDFKKIEAKWQDYWYNNHVFEVTEDPSKKKFYGLIEFPYPSGSGLHVGHIRAFSAMEMICRKKRMQGYNVLFPIGYDAFGLPTENYALKTGRHPRAVTDDNIKIFDAQLKKMGYSFDFSRVIDTTDPDYFKWTQWIFIQLFKNGLAYKSTTLVNYCPDCRVVLANEESQNGICDRCGSEVVQKEKDVWFLRIRKYAERLLNNLKNLDFLDKIKIEQENWIGKSKGADIIFKVTDGNKEYNLTVYTTRPDTIFGATFMVISPEHPLLDEFCQSLENKEEIEAYRKQAKGKKELERVFLSKEKTGVPAKGIFAINPVTKTRIPVFTADYVMMDYGTGAIMAVPAHDTRDWEFAKAYDLPIIEVISGGDIQKEAYIAKEGGKMVNSGFLNGMEVGEAIPAMIEYLQKEGLGYPKTDYKMKDWAFNRQRYWGEPIPIVNCPKCGQVPMREEDLPLTLPEVSDITPGEDAQSPLAKVKEWVHTVCPVCGGPAERETDTMPQWAGSSWYFLRYMSPRDDKHVVDPGAYKYWGQVDWYNGGMEHVTRHLIYSRFWNMFLYDIGVVGHEEPYAKRTAQGLILGADGEKMSKSRGNVVNPDDVIAEYGADTLRTFIMFIGDYEKSAPWSPEGIKGSYKFLNRVWALQDMIKDAQTDDFNLDVLIKKVSDDFDALKFNTAIAAMMSAVNVFYKRGFVTPEEYRTLLLLLNPIVPHIASELYQNYFGGFIERQAWPEYDENNLIEDRVEIPIQIMGKLKGKIVIDRETEQDEVIEKIKAETSLLEGVNIKKVIYLKGKIINIIV